MFENKKILIKFCDVVNLMVKYLSLIIGGKKKTPCFRCFMPEIPGIEDNCDTEGIISELLELVWLNWNYASKRSL